MRRSIAGAIGAALALASCSGGHGNGATSSGSGISSSTSSGTGSTSGSTGTTGFAPFPHRSIPPLLDHGGHRMSGFTLVTVTASNDSLAAPLQAFGDALVQSQWYQTVAAPYDLAAPVASLHVAGGPAITTALGQGQVAAYIQAAIADGGPAPNGNTVYLLYIPEAGALDSPFIGYHAAFPAASNTLGDSFAVAEWSPVSGPVSQLDSLTSIASHEILEAATDPNLNGLFIGPAPKQPWTSSVWDSLQSGHIEIGDLCEGTLTEEGSGDAGFYYQRIFSNPIAEDGGDNPCLPLAPGPYYSVTVAQDWYAADAGDTLQIPVTGWSSAQAANWLVDAVQFGASPGPDGGFPIPTLQTDLGVGTASGCEPFEAFNNGVAGALTVQVPAQAASGDWEVLGLLSFVEGASPGGCDTPLGDDQYHQWLVGVYVR